MKSYRWVHVILYCAVSVLLVVACGNEACIGPAVRDAEDGARAFIAETPDLGDVPSQPSGTDIKKLMFDDPEFPLRLRIRGLVDAYAKSCEDRDIDAYGECLHDDFKFIFTPRDAEEIGLPPDEPWWFKPEDLIAMGNMFSVPEVDNITFDYEIVPGCAAKDPSSAAVGVRIDPDIAITFVLPGEEPITYWLNSTYLDLTVVRDADNLWVIHAMEEILKEPGLAGHLNDANLAAQSATFGQLKAMFR